MKTVHRDFKYANYFTTMKHNPNENKFVRKQLYKILLFNSFIHFAGKRLNKTEPYNYKL